MVYSNRTRFLLKTAVLYALSVSFVPAIHASSSSSAADVCGISDGDRSVGIRAIEDTSCASGGLGCYNDHCRFCKVLETPQSSAFENCTAFDANIPTMTPLVPSSSTCEVSRGDVAAGISAFVDTNCLYGGLGCFNDHCRFCKMTKTPQSEVFVDCPKQSTGSSSASDDDGTSVDASTDGSADTSSSASSTAGATRSCTLVPAAGDINVGISIGTDPTCSAGGLGCINDVCRFCRITTTTKSIIFRDCALLGKGANVSTDTSVPSTNTPTTTTETPAPTTETPAPTTETPAPTTETPAPTTETPAPTTETPAPTTETPAPTTETPAPTTETPAPTTETPAPTTETPAPITETPAPTTETPAPTTETPAPTTETPAPITETPAPTTETPAPTTETPAPTTETPASSSETPDASASSSGADTTCTSTASVGDAAVGIRIVTDKTCVSGGVGCITDVCRFCKVTTSIQSAAFLDCALFDVNGSKTPVVDNSDLSNDGDQSRDDSDRSDEGDQSGDDDWDASSSTDTPTLTPATVDGQAKNVTDPSSNATCVQTVSDSDAAVGINIVTDKSCVAGGVGCIDDVCRYCRVTTSIESAAFVDCSQITGSVSETPATTDPATIVPTTDAPTDTNAPSGAPSNTPTDSKCTETVSEGDAAVGINIVTDTSCSTGGVGCIDNVCRFCKVTTTVQSSAFVDCSLILGATLSSEPSVGMDPVTDAPSETPIDAQVKAFNKVEMVQSTADEKKSVALLSSTQMYAAIGSCIGAALLVAAVALAAKQSLANTTDSNESSHGDDETSDTESGTHTPAGPVPTEEPNTAEVS